MLTYQEYEKTVFDWLIQKRKSDPKFTFSVRLKSAKGAENDFFIGTEKSSYFATTFWLIPVSFPGSSSDCIDLLFGYTDNGYHYNFEFTQTMNPEGDQNESALNLVKSVRAKIEPQIAIQRETKATTKMYTLKTKPRKSNYSEIEEMLEDIWTDLQIIFPAVDEIIQDEKSRNPNFIAERIGVELFDTNLQRMNNRLNRNRKDTSSLEEREVESSGSPKNSNFKFSLNQILYGPPGTGKTYSTVDRVVEICDNDFQKDNHEHNKQIYNQLVKEGRVVFTTFHQSYAYEDFIEGIKPVKPDDSDSFLKYDIEPGVFKQIANTAKTPIKVQTSDVDWDNVHYYKMSIGGKNRPDIHNWCVENNVVGLGWGGEEDLSVLNNIDGIKWENYRDNFRSQFPKTAEEKRYHIQASYIFKKMKMGDIVVISKGNHVIDAIGKITSEYFFDDTTPTDMYHFRKVEWIVKDMEAAPAKFIDKQISQQSIYEFSNEDVKKDVFKSLTSKTKVEEKPYVIVIDEINRGNVSAIFGELITLIEDDKRLGAKNELTVTLPYSKEKFGVPSNLYIIGTMNTADRSVEALDTALRRRFSFEEMLPKPALLKEPIEGISLEKLLITINERIEVLVDRDHTIGHAFFIDDKSLDDVRNTFANKVIPLLQEYFYGDYSKMEMVIGSAFFDVKETSKVKFAVKSDNFDPEGKVYHIRNIASKEVMSDEVFKKALTQLLNTED